MTNVKDISVPTEVPGDQNYILIMYGKENLQSRHSKGLTITVNRSGLSDELATVALHTMIDSAKTIAKREGISTIYVCR
jgi:hypothetical protein